MSIRTVTPDDAAAFLNLQHQLDREAEYMSVQPDERQVGEKEQRDRLRRILKQPNSTILVADTGEGFAGYCAAYGGKQARNKHRAGITVAVLQQYQRRGIATRLISSLESWTREGEIRRLELTVVEANYAALCFYLSVQFTIEGRRKASIYIAERGFFDELHLGKVLVS
jgi:ribosomal protein S18 acetylase RimI-like enzyme